MRGKERASTLATHLPDEELQGQGHCDGEVAEAKVGFTDLLGKLREMR